MPTEEVSKLQKLGIKDVEKADVGVAQQDKPDVSQQDFLSLIKNEFVLAKPVLTLVQEYLWASNGTHKTKENCVADFRKNHPKLWKLVFLADLTLKVVYFSLVLLVVIRGLGLVEFVKTWFNCG